MNNPLAAIPYIAYKFLLYLESHRKCVREVNTIEACSMRTHLFPNYFIPNQVPFSQEKSPESCFNLVSKADIAGDAMLDI